MRAFKGKSLSSRTLSEPKKLKLNLYRRGRLRMNEKKTMYLEKRGRELKRKMISLRSKSVNFRPNNPKSKLISQPRFSNCNMN